MKTKQIYCIFLLSTFSKQELEDFKSFLSVKTNLINFKEFQYTSIKKLGNALTDICLDRLNRLDNMQIKTKKLNYEKEFKDTIEKKLYLKYKENTGIFGDNERIELLKNLREYLYPQAKLFLAFKQLKIDTQQIDILHLRNSLFNTPRFETSFKLAKLIRSKLKGFDYHSYNYYLLDLKFQHECLISKNYSKIEIKPLKKATDAQYIINKLELFIYEISLNFTKQRNVGLLKEIGRLEDFLIDRNLVEIEHIEFLYKFSFKYIESLGISDPKELSMYYDELFFLLSNQVYKKAVKTGLYKILVNNLAIRIYHGEDLQLELHKTYKILLEQKKLIINNSIDLITFRSIISSACRANNIDWAKKFYIKHLKYTPEEKQNHLKQFFKILFDFYDKKYDDTLQEIEKIKNFKSTINDDYEVSTRIFLLKCLFEVEFEQRFFHILKKERQFFIESKYLNEDKKKYYSNFVRILENLIKIKNKDNVDIKQGDANKKLRANIDKIERELSNEDLVCDKPWIMEKVEYLKK